METLNFESTITAPVQEVWDLLWNPETYAQWRRYIRPGAKLKTDWLVDGRSYFIDENNKGFVSTIVSLDVPFEVVFRHLGTFDDGIEDTETRLVKQWSGMEEKYFLRAISPETTALQVIVHAYQDYEEQTNDAYHQGLELLKKIAES